MSAQIYDTTLRDGTQREGISLSCDDKLRIARRLDDLGVHYIEGGWPGSNPKDAEFFERVRAEHWKQAVITSFGSTCRVGGQPADDANIRALLDAGTAVCTLVGKASLAHVGEVLRTTPAENLRIIGESIAYLVGQGRRVFHDAEHFFDGYKLNPDYAVETVKVAFQNGAEVVILCDTNGGSMPWEVAAIRKFAPQMDFGVAPVPVPDDHRGPVFTYGDYKDISIFSTTTHPMEAWEFVKFLVSAEHDLLLLRICDQIPVRGDLLENPLFAEYFRENPAMTGFARQAVYTRGMDDAPDLKEIFDAIAQEYESCAVYGRVGPSEAIREAVGRTNLIVEWNR